MSRGKLTNKQRVVLELLRGEGPRTCLELADMVRQRTPCGFCDGTGEGDDSRYGCRRCYGHGLVPFHYSDAYVALKALRERGLVSRRFILDQFGDVTNRHIYEAVPAPDATADDLEALWNLPTHKPTATRKDP